MKYIILIIPVVLFSCSSSKKLKTKNEKSVIETETVKVTEIESTKKDSDKTTDITEGENLTEEIIETDYTNIEDPKTGKIISTVAKVKITKRSKSKDRNTKEVIIESEIKDSVKKSDSINISESSTSSTVSETKKFSNIAIVKGFYTLIVLALGGYIVVKKYFPSIFVKLKKLLNL